ncbi:efflux RND transporter periplasmic adaptor subunit [Pacificimonas flava]|uniref:Co/Zn/Cd efflux system membrane fusion protein n=1 Tax=Pacificimonas flava TaxID=1234595 RepID=M2S941_9SPHN|nr:efflux RND transporter periplasmic adaptor subunit [Pacificimonas flava]EMD81875.1 Co/Zn/Cd efflux system membrane fusion protein [Pacificimonas flava]MBB5281596.1 RND family efflux transporter MFP subunit [Pacificimonas flava]
MNMHTKIASSSADAPKHPAARRSKRAALRRGAFMAVPLFLAAWAGYEVLQPAGPANAAPPQVEVTVANPVVREITEWDEYVGRFSPSRTVEVRPRVAGEVTGVHFEDGALVRRGDLLFTIDPRPFEAALAEAQARRASAVSSMNLADAELTRALELVDIDAVSASEVDRLRAEEQAAQAAVAAADADVRARTLDLGFTKVRAPIAGRISDRRIDAGNQVGGGGAGTATLLTTINAVDPLYFNVEASEALFLKMRRAAEEGGGDAPIEIRLQDETAYRWKGRLDFTDNGLDPRSGTIRIRAVVDNPDGFLSPGMFGDAHLTSASARRALLVPDAAVQTDQARKIVTIIGDDGTAEARPVELGPAIRGLRVVRSGLSRSDRVVISAPELAQPGMKVETRPGRIAPNDEDRVSAPATTALIGGASFAAN